MSWPTKLAIAAAVLFAVGLGIWLALPDPQMRAAEQMQRHLAGDAVRKLPPAEQVQLRRQFFAQVAELSPRQQANLGEQRRQLLMAQIDGFLALSPTEKHALIDAEIDRLEALRREEERAAEATPGRADQRQRSAGRSAAEREQSFKQQLDATTPQERAKLATFFKQFTDRCQERGLTPGRLPDGL